MLPSLLYAQTAEGMMTILGLQPEDGRVELSEVLILPLGVAHFFTMTI